MDKTEKYTIQVVKVGNATVCIHRPILSEKERAKRTEELVSALGRYGRAIKEVIE